ncbi:hypothetical protein [Kitasatospora sp. NPDC058478]|uniref:hypothetical protein n=1 Tax=unclassified Kitasatospora TaxID=2633591 RepID=UPI003650C06F
MSADHPVVVGDEAAQLVARTGIPVLLLADLTSPPTLTAGIGGGPRRYTSTTALYEGGLRTEVHAPGGPDPAQLVRRALPGGATITTAYLATPIEMARAAELRHDGLLARAGLWFGWTLFQLTADGRRLPTLRLVGAGSLPEGRHGRLVPPPAS